MQTPLNMGFNQSTSNIHPDDNGRFLLIDIKVEDKLLYVANVYGPNNDDPDFYSKRFQYLQTGTMFDIIFGGDFNLILNETLDKLGGTPQHNNNKVSAVSMLTCKPCVSVMLFTCCTLQKNRK